jgi:hypothetical protein
VQNPPVMRKIIFTLLVVALVGSLAPIGRSDPAVLTIVRAQPRSDSEAAWLMNAFDETHNHEHDQIELLLWPGDRARLDAAGVDYEVVIPDLVAHDLRLASQPKTRVSLPGPDRSDYRRLGDYVTEMKQLAEENPKIVRLIELPEPSLEGRQVFGLEIAAPAGPSDGRPVYYVDGLHHAREWPAAEFVMIFAHHLVEGYGKDRAVTSLLKRTRVILIPVVNPDGFDYSRESPLSANQTVADLTWPTGYGNGFEGYWRKNRRSLTGVTVPAVQKNPDAYGVDPNRNYAYLWGDNQGGSSGFQLDTTYRGTEPFSEPETRNVRSVVLSSPVTGVITNHTYQATVLRTGGGDAPDDKVLIKIGDRLAAAMGYENRATVGYPTTGTTDDWIYAAMGALGFTFEHGSIGFHPPYAVGVGDLAPKVMKAFMIMGEVAADPRQHAVISGRVAAGRATLTLTKSFKTELSNGNPTGEKAITEKLKLTLKTRPDGRFVWHVPQSVRPYEKKPEAYTLTVTAGGEKVSRSIVLRRGDRVDVGTIRL